MIRDRIAFISVYNYSVIVEADVYLLEHIELRNDLFHRQRRVKFVKKMKRRRVTVIEDDLQIISRGYGRHYSFERRVFEQNRLGPQRMIFGNGVGCSTGDCFIALLNGGFGRNGLGFLVNGN